MYMKRHTFGTLDLHQWYKQVSCRAQYIHVSLRARFHWQAVAYKSMKKSKKREAFLYCFGAIYLFIVHRHYQIRTRDAGFGVGEETGVLSKANNSRGGVRETPLHDCQDNGRLGLLLVSSHVVWVSP